MKDTPHTPLPWHISEHGYEVRCGEQVGEFSITVAGCYAASLALSERKANAALIVRAVNSIDEITAQRDALLAALKATERELSAWHYWRAQQEGYCESDGYKETATILRQAREAVELGERGQK